YPAQPPSSIMQPDFTYYYDKTDSTTNHIVLIVGWDDNKVTLAPSPGAWIIKNSFGTVFGDKGYFYVSYQDTRINSSAAFFPNRIPVTANTVLYCYDKLGWVQSYGYSATIAYGLSKFSAASSQKLTKIGTYVGVANGTVDVEVYGTYSGGVLSNLLGTITTKTCTLPGHYYFDLPTPINITGGSDFYVKVKYYTPAYNWPVPVESIYSGFSNPTIETGKCWISNNGTSWAAVGTGTSGVYDMTIKAYAELQGIQLSINSSNPTVCEGAAVTLTANATGGTPAYSYSWSNTATTSSITVNPSASTTYTVTVSDAAPSTVTASISVFAYPFSQLTVSKTDETCASCNNGSATANATGNVPFAYVWNTNPVQITKTATNLSPGTYTVTAYDKYDCPMVETIEILSYNSVLEIHGGSFIQVYPNPNEGNFTVSVNTLIKEMLNIKIFNVLGEVVYSENCVLGSGDKTKEISLKEYGKGIYFLKIDGSTNNFASKIVYK
ncbi:MAG: lectin like domain-containing protein, partial [Bacteroidales bacterium]|nr:lectin like domain-containing protein [Bacteroidales bacterium]